MKKPIKQTGVLDELNDKELCFNDTEMDIYLIDTEDNTNAEDMEEITNDYSFIKRRKQEKSNVWYEELKEEEYLSES